MKNRKIKVRVWSKPLERFLTKDEWFLDFDGDLHFIEYDEDSNQYWPDRVPEENYVVQQYTGLKDSKGKEIYEGDIVKYHRGFESEKEIRELTSHIKFQDAAFGFDMKGFNDMFMSLENDSYIEVIGNIFENPELLK